MSYPTDFRYTKEHEWIKVEGGTGTVGITDHAQSTLGDIVFVELPKIGDSVSRGTTFGSVESVKAVSDLYSPVSGEVVSVNEELATSPEKINAEPHTTWMIGIKLSDPAELETLLSAADYEKFANEETGH